MGKNGGKWGGVFCTGTFDRNLDNKQRLLVPKTVKKSLTESNFVFVTPGQDSCLELHCSCSLEERSAEITQSGSGRLKKPFSRLFFAQAEKCLFDSQNRIRIPQRLIDWSKIGNKIVILGVGGYWEIWNEDQWQEYCVRHKSEFDRAADELTNVETTQTRSNEEAGLPLNPR